MTSVLDSAPEAAGRGVNRIAIAQEVRKASTSFYWAMRVLPEARRNAIFAVYAFCRAVDDVADGEDPPERKRADLAQWRREIDTLYRGSPSLPITRALQQPVADFELRRQDFLDIIDGMQMDADAPIVAPDLATLDLYCDRVASAVGRLCVCIFGEPGENGMKVAYHLGRALQLANIARDVGEDAGLGRLYLPRELLDKHRVPAKPDLSLLRHPAYPTLWRDYAKLAERQFEEAERALAHCDRRRMRAARIMMEVYRLNLRRMMALSDRELADPRRSTRLVGKGEKLLIALRHGFLLIAMDTVHIVGAGLAGLAAAVALAEAGHKAVIHEQTAQAGGRCRSFHDVLLDARIDNGNHLLLSGNRSALSFLETIGARDRLVGTNGADFPFLDLETGERWTVSINRGVMPWWILDKDRRVRGTTLADYLAGMKLLTAGDRTVAQLFSGRGQLYRRFWEPFTVAVLNSDPKEAAARLLLPVIKETLAKGADYSRPLIAETGLTETFIEPALKFLSHRGADLRLGQRITGLDIENGRVTGIATARAREPLPAKARVVLAVPAWAIHDLLPDAEAPDAFSPILNLHYRIEAGRQPLMETPMLGLIGSAAQWLFVRGEVASVTVSAAAPFVDTANDEIARRIWGEISRALDMEGSEMPRARVVKEHRATFLAAPSQMRRRAPARTPIANLVLAGDWTDTGLPATIEGAVRSGQTAASLLLEG